MKIFFNRKSHIKPLHVTKKASHNISKEQPKEKSILELIEDSNFKEYFSCAMGGSKDLATINVMMKRMVQFLQFSYKKVFNIPLKARKAFSFLQDVITSKYHILGDYGAYLENVKKRKASTIQAYLNDILHFSNWFVFHSNVAKAYPISAVDMTAFKDVVSKMRTSANKAKKQQNSEKTIENAVFEGKLPSGGLQELQEIVNSEIPWARQMVLNYVDKEAYTKFMELFFSALYVFSIQGRLSGIADVKYGQRTLLLDNKYVMSTNFKTSSTYGYQAITISDESKELLLLYLCHLRIKIVKTSEDDDSLWLRWNGTPFTEKTIGMCVQSFFHRKANLNCGTTMIRSLVETEFESMYNKNVISLEERKSIMNLSGHSSATVKNHYILQSRKSDVRHSMNAFAKSKEVFNERKNEEFIDYRETFLVKDWGRLHPQYSVIDPRAHIPWSCEEVDYIKCFVFSLTLPEQESNDICKRILKHIKEDDMAKDIFHVNHITNTQKIRNGYESFKRREFGVNRKRKYDCVIDDFETAMMYR
jgi:hypothetical protein